MAQRLKSLPPMQETRVWSLGWEDPLEKETAIHSSILAWRIPWMEKPSRLQSMGSQSRTRLSDFTSTSPNQQSKIVGSVCLSGIIRIWRRLPSQRNEKEHTCQMQKYFPSKWLQGFSVLLMKIREALRAIQGCTIRFRIKRAYKWINNFVIWLRASQVAQW